MTHLAKREIILHISHQFFNGNHLPENQLHYADQPEMGWGNKKSGQYEISDLFSQLTSVFSSLLLLLKLKPLQSRMMIVRSVTDKKNILDEKCHFRPIRWQIRWLLLDPSPPRMCVFEAFSVSRPWRDPGTQPVPNFFQVPDPSRPENWKWPGSRYEVLLKKKQQYGAA